LTKNLLRILKCCYFQFWLHFRFRSSFICQGTSTRRQRSDLFGLWVKLPLVTTRQEWLTLAHKEPKNFVTRG